MSSVRFDTTPTHVARLTLARPERKNAFDGALVAELTAFVRGDRLSFKMQMKRGGTSFEATFSGQVTGETLSGTWEFGSVAAGKWSAARQTERAQAK